jgi:hypothetical protein
VRNTGEDIFNSFNDFIIGNETGQSKYVDVNIDGVSAISGKHTELRVYIPCYQMSD